LSVIGIFLNRKNLIVLLMAIELMLLAVNMNFRGVLPLSGRHARPGVRVLHPDRGGGRVGHRLAILVLLFRNKSSINVEELNTLKG
jgi:NADH-quinone oxidoreductase subunit K